MSDPVGPTDPLPRRALLGAAAIYLAYVALVWVVLATVLLPLYDRLEGAELGAAWKSARITLDSELDRLYGTNGDWSSWDDAYAFMAAPAPGFVEENLTAKSLANVDLDLMLFFDPDRRLVVGRERVGDATREPDPALVATLAEAPVHGDPGRAGLWNAGGRTWLVAGRPVLDNDGGGPPRGSLVVARALTAGLLGPGPGALILGPPRVGQGARLVVERVEGDAQGYAALVDLAGRPVAGLRIVTLSRLREQGVQSAREVFLAASALGLGVVLAFLYQARRLARAADGRRAAEAREAARARHDARHDALTGLPNRAAFEEHLAEWISLHAATGRPFGVLFLDLDHFKEVNDVHGHGAGDRLLTEIARRLVACLRPGDLVARQGGDEFLLLLADLPDEASGRAVGERLLTAIREPLLVDGAEVNVTASLGLSLCPRDGIEAEALVNGADLAMYEAKGCGRDGLRRVDDDLHRRARRTAALRSRLARALSRGELDLDFQPVYALRTGRVVGVEALARWRPPEEPEVSPGVFIPIAEESGLILPIGEWVLNRALDAVTGWGRPGLRVAVNFSPRQLADPAVADLVGRALGRHHAAPSLLEVEITESLAMRNPELTRRVLAELRELGVSVALDDFGTGHSALSWLRGFALDRIKLDRSFIVGLDEGGRPERLVAAIIALAHSIDLEVVAEGVEHRAQLERLLRHGCDLAQGYALGRPMSATKLAALLAEEAEPQPMRKLAMIRS